MASAHRPDNIDEVIALIRAAKDGKEAKIQLMERFALTEPGTGYFWGWKWGLDRWICCASGPVWNAKRSRKNTAELQKMIVEYKAILADEQLVLNIIKAMS